MDEEMKKSETEPVKTEAEKLKREEKGSDTVGKKRNNVLKKAALYITGTAFFFWFQKYIPSLYFMYIDKISLLTRCLYSVVLSDTVISFMRKFMELRREKTLARIEGKSESGAESADSGPESTNSNSENVYHNQEIVPGDGNRIRNSLEKACDILFYLCFAGCYLLSILSITKLPAIIHFFAGIHRLGITLCCLLSLVLFNRKRARDARMLVFQLVMLIADFGFMGIHGGIWLFPVFIFIVTSYERRFMPMVRIALICSAALFILVFNLSMNGIIEFIIKENNKHALGYAGPNEASMQIFFFVAMYFFCRYYGDKKRKNQPGTAVCQTEPEPGKSPAAKETVSRSRIWESVLNITDAVILAAGIKLIVSYSSGRASICCILALTVLVTGYKIVRIYPPENWNKSFRNIVDKTVLAVFVPMYLYTAVFSFLSSKFFNRENPYGWIRFIGRVFNPDTLMLRMDLGRRALLNYSPSVFGTSVYESLGDDYFIVDCYYIKSFLQYGLIYFVCSLMIFTLVNYVCWKKKDYYTVLFLSILAGLGFLEAQIGEMMYNIFPLMLFTLDRGILSCVNMKKI